MINIPKGTKDVLPSESYKWHYVEDDIRKVAGLFGLSEIRTPTFEHTELFLRGVGDTTDIVNKEMYTFNDKGGRSITLKPEGTAGVARSFMENGLSNLPMPVKMYYITPVFRYEKPQAGRYREHHQFGVEIYGAESSAADVEAISIAKTLFDTVGLKKLELNLNSIGCRNCRKDYNAALRNYLAANVSEMCASCKERFEKNPLRILDCKEEKCKKITLNAPKTIDFLCNECKNHFEGVKKGLDQVGIPYVVNPQIVRGLDYYTRTVFEFVSTDIGAQGTVCGGGRYNHLVEEVGGKATPAVGFGMGVERLLNVLEALNLLPDNHESVKVYVAPIGEAAADAARVLVSKLRKAGISADTDLMGRSVKAQMKYADKIGAKYTLCLGDDEIQRGVATLKNMLSGESAEVNLESLSTYKF